MVPLNTDDHMGRLDCILILVVGGQATLVSFLKNKQNKKPIKYVWLYG